MAIKLLENSNEAWQTFLKEVDHFIVHTPEYKRFIEDTFKVKSYYVADVEEQIKVNDDGNAYTKIVIKALLPLFEIKSTLFGDRIISTPYLEYGGFAGNKDNFEEVISFIKKKFWNTGYIEVRHGHHNEILDKQLTKVEAYKRFTLLLQSKVKVWQNIQKSKRKAVNKSKEQVSVRRLSFRLVNEMYALYASHMKSFGSPPFPKSYFRNFFKFRLGECMGAFIDDKMVALLVGFVASNRVHIVINVSDPKYKECRPNDAVHWAFIAWACENGFKEFDFGRVREGSGQFAYKAKWGAKCSELNHYYLLQQAKKIPRLDPGEYKLASALWKKVPLPVANVIGPMIRKGSGM